MNSPLLLATYLCNHMNRRGLTAAYLAGKLPGINERTVQSWLNGWDRPTPKQLPYIALAIGVDHVELAMGWMIDSAPELEQQLQDRVLKKKGMDFPRSTDLDLCQPMERPALQFMHVGDPHDELIERSADISATAKSAVMKQPLKCKV